jgi:hypothetical protein
MLALLPLLSAPLYVSSCGSNNMMTTSPTCMELASYTPTTTTSISFATQIMPILTDTGNVPPNTPGCSTAAICHGSTPIKIDVGGTKTLVFADTPANVYAALMMNAVNAPTMARVAGGSVANSFMAYKISGTDGLSCIASSKCASGASVGTMKPCGDPMPTSTSGALTPAQRTLILDWIAQGAPNN